MNPMQLLKMKSAWDRFRAAHPKFPLFLNSVMQNGIHEGTILEFKVTGAGRQNLLFQSENQQGGSGALSGAEGAGPAEPVTYERRRQSLRRFSLLCNQTLHDPAFRPVSIISRCAPELLFLKHLHLPAWCRSVRSETDTSDM